MTTFLERHRDRIALWAALAVPPGACAALIPARASLPNTDAALLLVVLVVAVAAAGNRAAGWLAAASGAVWFDFFLTRPYERLAITHRADVQTTALLVLVGVAVTELAVRSRRRHRVAAADEAFLAVIASTGALVARGETAQAVIGQVAVQLKAMLGARGCAFEPGEARARGLRVERDGAVMWGGTRWNLEEHGYPDEPVVLPARYNGRVYGRFVLDPAPGAAPALGARQVAVVLADLAAAALAHDQATQPKA